MQAVLWIGVADPACRVWLTLPNPRSLQKGETVMQTRRKPIRRRESVLVVLVVMVLNLTVWLAAPTFGADPWVVYKGSDGPGKGKHVVLVSGDEEYRSEEALPQLGKILARHHGFTCTVLFAIGKDGTIDPNRSDNIPGLEALRSADLMIIATRFRNLPDDQMKEIVDYVESGRPIIGMRTATHAFNLTGKTYAKYSWNSKAWDGGFGRQVLGETWVNHHGHHGRESTRGSSRPARRIIRSSAASRTATSGGRPTCMKPTRPPTARRWSSARCSRG